MPLTEFLVAAVGPQCSLDCRCLTPVSAPFVMSFSLCVQIVFIRTPVIALGACAVSLAVQGLGLEHVFLGDVVQLVTRV